MKKLNMYLNTKSIIIKGINMNTKTEQFNIFSFLLSVIIYILVNNPLTLSIVMFGGILFGKKWNPKPIAIKKEVNNMEVTINIKPFTSSTNRPIIDVSQLYFVSSEDNWTKARDEEGYEFEYKKCEYFTYKEKIALELIRQGYAFNLKIKNDNYCFTMLKKY